MSLDDIRRIIASFTCTELNINRLAVSLEDLKKMGAEIQSE